MVKLGSSDMLSILRQFGVAGSDRVPRNIEQLSFSHPSDTNTVALFRFNKHRYAVLLDDTADDDIVYIIDQINGVEPDIQGEVVANPHDESLTYGLPYKGKDVYLFAANQDKHRLDSWLATRNPDISRSTWQKHIKAGSVLINNQPQLSTKYDVAPDDSVTIQLPAQADYSNQTLPMLYEDDNVIVVDKPAGVLTHAKGALNEEFTVADFFARLTTYKSDTNRPGIIHRLDRDTSGVIIGVRNDETAKLLQKQFADRKVKKTYVAIVEGQVTPEEATIDVPIGRNPSAPSTFRADVKGKSAQTYYKVLKTRVDTTLVALTPHTGRTHQLRIHMAHIGHPIVGDRIYGRPAERLYLHAHTLEITIPTSRRVTFTAELPPAFRHETTS